MIDHIDRIQDEAKDRIQSAPNLEELEKLRVHYLGKKGLITGLLHQLKDVSPEKRKELGAVLNGVKGSFEKALTARQTDLEQKELEQELSGTTPLDLTLAGTHATHTGSFHPVTLVLNDAIRALQRVGFSVASGPEIETEFYNFEALNTPEHHPARDTQDTFYVAPGVLLRSHTSPMQIRTMRGQKPPIQGIAFGRVYRSDYDQTHTPMFHQLECFMVDEHVSFSDLKGIVHYLLQSLFGSKPIRFRPSYFPFTEPSAEVDMMFGDRGWLELGGCGMIHPNVMKACNLDSDQFTGFAFGMGIERIAMLKYGVQDLRSFFENDTRMLEQFS